MSDLYICGTCSTQYTNLDIFLEHKGTGCSLRNSRKNVIEPISPLKVLSNQVCTATNGLNVGGSSLTPRQGPNCFPDHKAAGTLSTSSSFTPNTPSLSAVSWYLLYIDCYAIFLPHDLEVQGVHIVWTIYTLYKINIMTLKNLNWWKQLKKSWLYIW